MEQYKEETYDPLSCYSPAERKQIEEQKRNEAMEELKYLCQEWEADNGQ